jgi:hypothetical protein
VSWGERSGGVKGEGAEVWNGKGWGGGRTRVIASLDLSVWYLREQQTQQRKGRR